jgi:hypothetical protein
MRTHEDIRESLRARAEDAAPVEDVLARLLGEERRPRRAGRMNVNVRIAAAPAAVLAVAAASLAIVRHEDRVRHEAAPTTQAAPAPIGPQARWPDSYSFGSDSLPGYTLTRTDMQLLRGAPAASTTYTYATRSANRQATLRLLSASELGRYRNGTPVTVNGTHGYYQAGSSSLPYRPERPTSTRGTPAPTGSSSSRPPLVPPLSSAIAWPISKDSWAVLTAGPASFSYIDGKLETPAVMPSQAVMVDLAESVRLRESPTVAPVKVDYLPANLELLSVQQFLESPSTFDNRFGSSYRDLMFVDRSASRSQLFTLDVGVLVAPQKPLELKDLPDARTVASGNWSPKPYDPAKQWTQTTIAGHRAFVSAHDVIVDWGGVEVHVTNENFPYAVKPVLSQRELIRIAASLTVPPSGAIGNGYRLSQAVPAANLR